MAPIKAFGSRREGRLLALLAALSLGGCSMSIPGFIDKTPTGSIKSPNYPFDSDDWAKVEPALIAAIRADASDDPAAWSNSGAGRSGAIEGVGARFTRDGGVCRAFVARIRDGGEAKAVQGAACEKAGVVTISDAGPFRGV
jgi:hypothetical protein